MKKYWPTVARTWAGRETGPHRLSVASPICLHHSLLDIRYSSLAANHGDLTVVPRSTVANHDSQMDLPSERGPVGRPAHNMLLPNVGGRETGPQRVVTW